MIATVTPAAVQRRRSFIRGTELRADVAARRIRQGVAAELRHAGGELFAVVRRARPSVPEAGLGRRRLLCRRTDDCRRRVHSRHCEHRRRHAGRSAEGAGRRLNRKAVVPVAIDRDAEGCLGRRDVAADLDVAVVLLDLRDAETRSGQPGLHARDGAGRGAEALEVLARLEEMAELRVARSRDGQRELLELGHAAVRRQVDPSTYRRSRRSVAQILGVAEPRRPRVRDRLAPGGCTGGAQRTGRTSNDCRGADDHNGDARACEPESQDESPFSPHSCKADAV